MNGLKDFTCLLDIRQQQEVKLQQLITCDLLSMKSKLFRKYTKLDIQLTELSYERLFRRFTSM